MADDVAPGATGDTAFSVDGTSVTFGAGCLGEAGDHARALGIRRIALMTDPHIAATEHVDVVRRSLDAAGIDVAFYDRVRIEPTDRSFEEATRFARESRADGFLSIGGGSVMDSCKAASLYATYPADFLTYVNAPIGEARPVPGPLKPHIACPTTSGTGSECTGIAICDVLSMKAKTGIVSRHLRPTMALVDPAVTSTLPAPVVAATGLDVLSHALESYTALPYTRRKPAERPSLRPMSQGSNPWSDLGCEAALSTLGDHLLRAVQDPSDVEARTKVMWAATLAGIAFGNAGCHVPHAMSYSVSGLVRDFRAEGYPQEEPLVPHGMSVIVNAPALFRHTAAALPERHLRAAGRLGADVRNMGPEHAGEVLSGRIVELMCATGMPNGLQAIGYGEDDVPALTEGAFAQKRLIDMAPLEIERDTLAGLFRNAMRYW
jgi:hydroxyacid-oxoacid transhydrogenase